MNITHDQWINICDTLDIRNAGPFGDPSRLLTAEAERLYGVYDTAPEDIVSRLKKRFKKENRQSILHGFVHVDENGVAHPYYRCSSDYSHVIGADPQLSAIENNKRYHLQPCPFCAGGKTVELTCQRCGHIWIPRESGRPTRCPGCGSAAWDKPRNDSTPGPKPKR